MSRRPTGWRGWSCTDNSTAQTVAQQKAAALLLTLSNLLFLAPIAVSVYRSLLVEAAVYTYTMFFSTVGLPRSRGNSWEVWASTHCPAPQFYHACDQPGEAVLCILNYDTLQYCDFLGSGVSMWVTILCMARLKAALKYVSHLLTPPVWALGEQRPLHAACRGRDQKEGLVAALRDLLSLMMTSLLLEELLPAGKGLCWLLEDARKGRWWAGLGEAPPSCLSHGAATLGRTSPDVLLASLVLRMLWGLFCLSAAWPMGMCALVPHWANFLPQKFTCGQMSASNRYRQCRSWMRGASLPAGRAGWSVLAAPRGGQR